MFKIIHIALVSIALTSPVFAGEEIVGTTPEQTALATDAGLGLHGAVEPAPAVEIGAVGGEIRGVDSDLRHYGERYAAAISAIEAAAAKPAWGWGDDCGHLAEEQVSTAAR